MADSSNSTVKIILSRPESSSLHLEEEVVDYEISLELKDILLQLGRAQTQEILPNSPAVRLVNTTAPNFQARTAIYTGSKHFYVNIFRQIYIEVIVLHHKA